ncbi:MAG: riboflavin synthase [Chloroflexi bacterium]|nr:riboflavin synthase [Chloroflexota bacterium]MBI2979584.1 riboflavin synthase [Chloroflexota bacterium]
MFTGIIEETGVVISAQSGKLVVAAGAVLQDMELGGSIAVNGVCLTVTSFDASSLSVDIMLETLKRSNLGQLSAGDRVNLERPLALGGRLGGHLVQGHIDATGRVASIRRSSEANIITVEASAEVMVYVVEKGFIAVDGISLTVVAKNASSFQVSIVDYTRRHTTLNDRRVGDPVNLEVDIIAKYVEQLSQPRGAGITVDFLQEHGFLVS